MTNPARFAVVRTLGIVAALVAAYGLYLRFRGPSYALESARATNSGEGYHGYVKFGDAPDDVRDDLATLQAAAVEHARSLGAPRPDGLRVVLDPLLKTIDYRVLLDASDVTVDAASFEAYAASLPPLDLVTPDLGLVDRGSPATIVKVAPQLGRLDGCKEGITSALKGVTGSDVVVADDDSLVNDPLARTPRLELHARASASGNGYTAAVGLSRSILPGVRLAGKLVMIDGQGVPHEVPFDVTPPAQLSFTTFGPVFVADDGDLTRGMVETLCAEIGLALDQQLVGWAPALDSLGDRAGSDTGSGASRHAR